MTPYHAARAAFERAYWEEVLKEAEGKIGIASRIAGVNRTWCSRLVAAAGLEGEEIKSRRQRKRSDLSAPLAAWPAVSKTPV